MANINEPALLPQNLVEKPCGRRGDLADKGEALWLDSADSRDAWPVNGPVGADELDGAHVLVGTLRSNLIRVWPAFRARR